MNKINIVERSSGFFLVNDNGPLSINPGPFDSYEQAEKFLNSKNLCNKCLKKTDQPYEVWVSRDGTWTWNVLKKYQSPAKEAGNEFARWFCNVVTPMCPHGELGDCYVKEIQSLATRVK